MSYAVLFPGQGSQHVGMGAELFEAHPDLLGPQADDILGWSLRDVCLNGPEDRLTRTEHAQPALFALAYALWIEFSAVMDRAPAAAAGHSLGEYTALTASGVFDYADALRLVAERGRAMADAAEMESSGMAALLGSDIETAVAVVSRRRAAGGRLAVANVNAPGQVVVAGGADDIAWLQEKGREIGVRRVVPLKVAGAFHSPFMQPAAERLASALANVHIAAQSFPVFSNVSAEPFADDGIVPLLERQVVSPVRFADSLVAMGGYGVTRFVHIGPGDVTAGMARRTVPGSSALVVSDSAGIRPAVQALSTMHLPEGDR